MIFQKKISLGFHIVIMSVAAAKRGEGTPHEKSDIVNALERRVRGRNTRALPRLHVSPLFSSRTSAPGREKDMSPKDSPKGGNKHPAKILRDHKENIFLGTRNAQRTPSETHGC